MSELITDDSFGAWLLKCNPDVFDLPALLAEGFEPETWTVQDNYRSRRMRSGDPFVLWVTGRKAGVPSGVWAVGVLDGPLDVAAEFTEDDADSEDGFWIDDDKRLRSRFFVPITPTFLKNPVPRQVVQSYPELAGMEVFRSPAMSNPNWLTRDEWGAMRDLLDTPLPEARTEDEPPPPFSEIDPLTKAAVELAAIDTVWTHLEAEGWEVEDNQSEKIGWDLTATRPGQIRRVEVKGRGTAAATVMITANEFAACRATPGWELAVVTSALTQPTLVWYTSDQVAAAAQPVSYRFDLAP